MNASHADMERFESQAGGGMLTVVAALGFILMMVQGTVYYHAKSGARFLGTEKNKVLAMQMAEAGVEENIADLGKRITRVHAGLTDTTTYYRKPLEGGSYTSTLSTVAIGDSADTVDLASTGMVKQGTHSIHARLKLRKHIDITRKLDSTVTFADSITVLDPATVPLITAADLCPTATCDVCHVPPAGVTMITKLNQARGIIVAAHGGALHRGDYITLTGACTRYLPVITASRVVTYDTADVVDTAVKVQILSWK